MDEEYHQQTACKTYDEQLCSPGYFLKVDRSPSSDRICESCSESGGSSTSNARLQFQSEYGSVATSCTPVSTCGRGEYTANIPTDSRDRDCRQCAAGSFQSEAAYIGTTCSLCPNGFYSGEGASACTPHTNCDATSHKIANGTSVSNTVCKSCIQGQYFVIGGTVLDSFTSLGSDTACGGTGVIFTQGGRSFPYNQTTSGDFEDCLSTCAADPECTAYEENSVEELCTFFGHSVVTSSSESESECYRRDTSVTSCQPCGPGTYNALTKHIETSCTPVTRCQKGERMIQESWPDVNQVCVACEAGTFQDEDNHTISSCKSPRVCVSLGLGTALPATLTSDAVCSGASASTGVGNDDAAANASFGLLVALIVITAGVLYKLNRHYGGGAVAKAKKDARQKRLKAPKLEEGREPDEDSDTDNSDDEEETFGGVSLAADRGRDSKVVLPKVSSPKVKTYKDGTVDPRHIEGSRVQFLDKLGEGAFGAVYLGFYDPPDDDQGNIGGAYNVAVKVLKQGALTEKQLAMMSRKEILEQLHSFDNASIPRVTAESDTIVAAPGENAYDQAGEGDVDATIAVTAAVSNAKPKKYNQMSRESLIAEILARQKLVKGTLKGNALVRGELENEIEWTKADLQAQVVAMDDELAAIRYSKLDKNKLIDEILVRQSERHITHRSGEFNKQQLERQNREQLVELVREFDDKELRINTYGEMPKIELIRAYAQRENHRLSESDLEKLEEQAIRKLLLDLDDDFEEAIADEVDSSDDDGYEESIGATPLLGWYSKMEKAGLINAVLERQQQIADARAEEKMKEAYRDFWWEARTMAAICAGSGQLRVRYGSMTKQQLLAEVISRDVRAEVRRRTKRKYQLKPDSDIPGSPLVVMTKAEEYAWKVEREKEWGETGENWSVELLTNQLLRYDDSDGKLHGHANIAKIIGVVSDEKPDQVLLQLAENGELKKYLELHDPQTAYKVLDESALVTMCHDICSGMAYLESQGWIHGDLACRNVLINALQVCQVADFGMTKYQGLDIENNGLGVDGRPGKTLKEKQLKYVKYNTQFPVRWCPPEVVGVGHDRKAKRHFSHKSDAWAFGITVYEIFTAAETPYSRVTDPEYCDGGPMRNKDVKRFVLDGKRLRCPRKTCDQTFFDDVVIPCWERSPSKRPTFEALESKIARRLKAVLQDYRKSKLRFRTHMRRRVIANSGHNDINNGDSYDQADDSGNYGSVPQSTTGAPATYDVAGNAELGATSSEEASYDAADNSGNVLPIRTNTNGNAYDMADETGEVGVVVEQRTVNEAPYSAAETSGNAIQIDSNVEAAYDTADNSGDFAAQNSNAFSVEAPYDDAAN